MQKSQNKQEKDQENFETEIKEIINENPGLSKKLEKI